MGQEIAVQQAGSSALASVTPYSLTSLESLVPEWVQRDLFDDGVLSLPAHIPADGPSQLIDVAAQFRASLETLSDNASLNAILGELRLRTVTRNESEDEQRARFRLLREDCTGKCLEAVREGARAYAQDNKFFPAGLAELLPYIRAAENKRAKLMYRLTRLADEAEKELKQRAAYRRDPVPPGAFDELLGKLGQSMQEKGQEARKRDYSQLREPTYEDLIELGIAPDTARAMAGEPGQVSQ